MKGLKAPAAALFLLFALAPLAAQEQSAASGASVEDRLRRLESDLRLYKTNYAKLEGLFQDLAALTQKVIASGDELSGEVMTFLEKNRELQTEVDRTLEESQAVIDFLKNKVYERPTLLLETELSWHILLGEELAFSFVWEPLPWLGVRAGAELWYTDSFRPAFPVALRLRFGLD
jgi:hypothetical protein